MQSLTLGVAAGKFAVFQLTKAVLAFLSAASEALLYRCAQVLSECLLYLQAPFLTGLSARATVGVVDCVCSSTDTCVKHSGVHSE